MDFIEHLADELEREWQRQDLADEVFPAVAIAILDRLELHDVLSTESALRVAIERLKDSRGYGFHRGDEVIQLFENDLFSITLHSWTYHIGSPHSHTWHGAFQALTGDVVHAEYEFLDSQALAPELYRGRRVQKLLHVLPKGKTVPVYRHRTIHGIGHSHIPSLTLAVRSRAGSGQTLEYCGRGLALRVDVSDELTVTRTRCLRAIRLLDRGLYDTELYDLLSRVDLHQALMLLRNITGSFPGLVEDLVRLVRSTQGRWGDDLVQLMVSAAENFWQDRAIESQLACSEGAAERKRLLMYHFMAHRAEEAQADEVSNRSSTS